MLAEMLKNSTTFQELPIPVQSIYLTLANRFEDNTLYLTLNPEELAKMTGVGNKKHWYDFLLLNETSSYIKSQMAFLANIAQRKTFASLLESALGGNNQAAKEIQNLSGIMNSVDNNKIVVLHSVPRPTKEVK